VLIINEKQCYHDFCGTPAASPFFPFSRFPEWNAINNPALTRPNGQIRDDHLKEGEIQPDT
jgi:hypothetical protein